VYRLRAATTISPCSMAHSTATRPKESCRAKARLDDGRTQEMRKPPRIGGLGGSHVRGGCLSNEGADVKSRVTRPPAPGRSRSRCGRVGVGSPARSRRERCAPRSAIAPGPRTRRSRRPVRRIAARRKRVRIAAIQGHTTTVGLGADRTGIPSARRVVRPRSDAARCGSTRSRTALPGAPCIHHI